MQKQTKTPKFPRVISNWYVEGKQLWWWAKNENKSGTAGTSNGRDYSGMGGNFTGHNDTITAWKRDGNDSWIVTGASGKQYLAQFSTRYSNYKYYTRYVRSPEEIETKLKAIVASD